MPEKNAKLFVSGLPEGCVDADLERLFDDMPGFLSASVTTPQAAGKNPFGFVKFETDDDAEVAKEEKNSIKLGGSSLAVVYANPDGARRDVKGPSTVPRLGAGRRGASPPRHTVSSRGPRSADEIDARSMGPYEFKFQDYLRRNRPHRDDAEPRTLIVRQLPYDITEREMMHLFRPFFGFKSVSVVPPKKKSDTSPGRVCFIAFAHRIVADFAMQQLDGYDFDGNGLRINVQMVDPEKDRRSGGGAAPSRDARDGERSRGGRDRDRDRPVVDRW